MRTNSASLHQVRSSSMKQEDKKEISSYMKSIGRYALLTREEESECGKRILKGDRHAEDMLVTANLRFVVSVAHQFSGYCNCGHFTLMDLIQEGNRGLIRAATKYDYRKGYRFLTYAVWWIKAYIQKFIVNQTSLVKMGTTSTERQLFFKQSKIKELQEIRDPELKDKRIHEFAKELRVDERDIRNMESRLAGNDLTLDRVMSNETVGEGQAVTFKDNLNDEGEQSEQLEEVFYTNALRDLIRQSMTKLNKREREIIKKRYLGVEKKTLTEIAKGYNLSRERVRQIEANALKKIRQSIRVKMKKEKVVSDGPIHIV